ncbi:MAG: S8 family serine peptidase, partial [Pyrinomonadaceae bacterium]
LGKGSISGVLAALDWVMANRLTYNVKVVNLSLGAPAVSTYTSDPLCKAVRRLVDAGLVVVTAAGNDGKDANGQKLYGAIHSPGNEPSAITVGATNTFGTNSRGDDQVASYSSSGPTRSYRTDAAGLKHYDNFIKPDLVAPGNKLIAAEAVNNYLVTQNPSLETGLGSHKPNEQMMYLSGTSGAAPAVAGAAALLLQANPQLTPNMVKMILMYTAQQLSGFNTLQQGAGALNMEGAIRLAKLVRTNLPATPALGTQLLTTSTGPVSQSTIDGTTFQWAQGIIMDQTFARGSDLITKYQKIYARGVLLSDGTLFNNGVLLSDSTMMSSGVLLSDNILTSSGVLLGDGYIFLSCGVLLGDGVLLSDGVLL